MARIAGFNPVAQYSKASKFDQTHFLAPSPGIPPDPPGLVESLSPDVLALIAGGRQSHQSMRGVAHTWQAGFDLSVTILRVGTAGPLPAYTRFPALTLLDLRGFPLGAVGLEALSAAAAGLPHLTCLRISLSGSKTLTDDSLERLRGLPVVFLDLSACPKVTGAGLRHLRGAPLDHLRLQWCKKLAPEALSLLPEFRSLRVLALGGVSAAERRRAR